MALEPDCCKHPVRSLRRALLNHAKRGSGQRSLRHELGCLQKVIHLGRDFELLRDNDGVSGQQLQLLKASVAVTFGIGG